MADNKDKTGPEAAFESAVEGVKGKAKEVFGTVTGNDDLRDEGRAQQDKAESLKEAAEAEAEAEKARAEAEVDESRQKAEQR